MFFDTNQAKTNEQLTSGLSHIIRVGYVTARQPEKHRVQVQCKDTVSAPLTTDWLLVLVPRAKDDMQYDLPDIGDQVLCIFLPIGLEQGFVLGCMYGKQTPPIQDAEKTHRKFKDGTTIEYDRASNHLQVKCVGRVTIKAAREILIESDSDITIHSKKTLTLRAPTVSVRANSHPHGPY